MGISSSLIPDTTVGIIIYSATSSGSIHFSVNVSGFFLNGSSTIFTTNLTVLYFPNAAPFMPKYS